MAIDPAPDAAVVEAWLTEALGDEAGAIVRIEPLGDGIGLLATLVRLVLEDGRRLVVKAPTSDAGNRAIAHRFGYYQREAGAYRDLLERLRARAPRCHGIADTADGPVLVLDDLSGLLPGDQLEGASAGEAFAAAELAAEIHAAFWNDPVLAVCPWLPGPTDPVIAVYGQLFQWTWDAFRVHVGDAIAPAHLAAAERAIEGFDAVCAAFSAAPRTLLHGDFRLDNLLFGASGHVVALDWQLAQWGRGPYDLALFAAGSIEPDVRRACEDELVQRYHRRLVECGVQSYELADCRRDYRLGHVLNLPNPVTALVAVSGGNERGRLLLEANARRALAAVADHEPFLSS